MKITDHNMDVLSAVENMAHRLSQLERLRDWSGLNLEQRAVAYSAIMMGAPNVTLGEVANRLGITPNRAEALMPRNGPLMIMGRRGVDMRDAAVCPSSDLAYGPAK